MARMESRVLINTGLKGLGAVAVIQVANNFAATLMANQILSFGFYGITLGAVLAAGIGIYAVDQLLLK